jgi:hypothetical protein
MTMAAQCSLSASHRTTAWLHRAARWGHSTIAEEQKQDGGRCTRLAPLTLVVTEGICLPRTLCIAVSQQNNALGLVNDDGICLPRTRCIAVSERNNAPGMATPNACPPTRPPVLRLQVHQHTLRQHKRRRAKVQPSLLQRRRQLAQVPQVRRYQAVLLGQYQTTL